MDGVVFVAAARTPFGRLGGALKELSAIDLGATAIAAVLKRSAIAPEEIDQVIMGNVISAGLGQVPARQAALKAGIPPSVSAFSINKVCASSMKAINLGAQLIASGNAEFVVAGGMESMSQAPYLLPHLRFGTRFGDETARDSMLLDGLCCPVDGVLMGVHGSDVARELGVDRTSQDRWAVRSQERYQAALARGAFAEEIVAVNAGKNSVSADEQPRADTTYEKLAALRGAFGAESSITAGNAPGMNDGGAAVLLAGESAARRLGLPILGEWLGCGESAAEHPYLATVPATAIQAALHKAGAGIEQMKLVEINEAFAAVAITGSEMLGANPELVNVNGGAIAVGHPIGASGARIVMTLLYELQRRGGGMGVAGICSGMAQGEATLVRVGA